MSADWRDNQVDRDQVWTLNQVDAAIMMQVQTLEAPELIFNDIEDKIGLLDHIHNLLAGVFP